MFVLDTMFDAALRADSRASCLQATSAPMRSKGVLVSLLCEPGKELLCLARRGRVLFVPPSPCPPCPAPPSTVCARIASLRNFSVPRHVQILTCASSMPLRLPRYFYHHLRGSACHIARLSSPMRVVLHTCITYLQVGLSATHALDCTQPYGAHYT